MRCLNRHEREIPWRFPYIRAKYFSRTGEEEMDDFSFPTISTEQDSLCQLPFPHFASSPLWFLSSVSDEKPVHHSPRSFSSAEEAAKITDTLNSTVLSNDDNGCNRSLSDEEKMDMLWEDFNEELCRVSCEWKKKDLKGKTGSSAASESDTEFCCVQALRVSKGGGSLLHHRMPSLVMMLKVLKKLFLIQKTRSTRRAPLYQI